jgi:2-dehydropantoate 2-reductase
MNILVYGAGVLGSLYGARLCAAGHGVLLEDAHTGLRSATRVSVVERLAPDDAYDLVIVPLRRTQIDAALPALAANRRMPSILFMSSTLAGPETWAAALGRERVVLGFAGAGGWRDGATVHYHILPRWQQPTTLGELDGRATPRLARIARALSEAGFPVAISHRMDAWLTTHVVWTRPVTAALSLTGGNPYRLARTRDALVLFVRAVRENHRALAALGVPVTPATLRAFDLMPEPVLIAVLRRLFATRTAEVVIAGHANTARAEYAALAQDWRVLTQPATVPTPAMERLSHVFEGV